MPQPFQRTQRIGDQIQRAISTMLQQKVSDPRFKQLSITGVDVSPDIKNATIYISQLDENNIDEVITALNKASGFFRHTLANQLDLRYTPKLKFAYDHTLKYGSDLSQLIDQANKDTNNDSQ
jgi:ribosome-binding factor A